MSFKRNLHALDRVIRALIGLVCVYIGFVDLGIIDNVLASTLVGIFGIINLFAAAVSYCPIYGIAGISTYRSDEGKAD